MQPNSTAQLPVQSVIGIIQESKRRKLIRFAAESLIIGLAIIPPLAGFVGFDFGAVYRESTLTGNFKTGFLNPWPAIWLYYPFAILPLRLGAALWGLVQAIGYIYALRRLGGNLLWFAFSLPCLWTFTQGQNEGFLAWGLVLGLCSPPVLAGLGLTLLSFKPQFGLPVILYILYKHRDWKLLIVPVVVYALSLVVWGFWFDDWILFSVADVASSPQLEVVNTSTFPYTLILFPLIFVFSGIPLLVLVFSLMLPYFACPYPDDEMEIALVCAAYGNRQLVNHVDNQGATLHHPKLPNYGTRGVHDASSRRNCIFSPENK